MRYLLLSIAALLLASAPSARADNRLTESALDAAEQKWRSAAQRDYSYTFTWSEFVSPCPGFRLDMVVKNRSPVRAKDCQKYRRTFSTVPSLFRYLRKALRARSYEVTAEFHPKLGYPLRAHVAWSDMDDDYFSFEVREFREND